MKKIFISLNICLTLLISSTGFTLAYNPLNPNKEFVIIAPYDQIQTGTADIGANAGIKDFITITHHYRVRQNGTIKKIRLYIDNPINVQSFYLTIWRKTDTTFLLIGQSENLAKKLQKQQMNIIDLKNSITVEEGDYYGFHIEGSDKPFLRSKKDANLADLTCSSKLETNAMLIDWLSQQCDHLSVPIELYMQAPQVIFLGDSIIAGEPTNTGFLNTIDKTNLDGTIEKYFGQITGYTYQNLGTGGATTNEITSTFTKNVPALRPRLVIVNGGVNDLAQYMKKDNFLHNWKTILDTTKKYNILTIIIAISPWSNGTDSQMITRDEFNRALSQLAHNYPNALIVDTSNTIGKPRENGPHNNYWDLQEQYTIDGIHLHEQANAEIAQLLNNKINANLHTRYQVHIHVVNKNNNPIDNAKLQLDDKRVNTNQRGDANFSNIAFGNHNLDINKGRYHTKQIIWTISENKNQNLSIATTESDMISTIISSAYSMISLLRHNLFYQ